MGVINPGASLLMAAHLWLEGCVWVGTEDERAEGGGWSVQLARVACGEDSHTTSLILGLHERIQRISRLKNYQVRGLRCGLYALCVVLWRERVQIRDFNDLNLFLFT